LNVIKRIRRRLVEIWRLIARNFCHSRAGMTPNLTGWLQNSSYQRNLAGGLGPAGVRRHAQFSNWR
jgi:hypothetical protein